eukprot:5085554-Ditylum_brightwellii.AAC.1
MACGANQLCSGLWASIEGGIHVMGLLWEEFGEEEGWDILLVALGMPSMSSTTRQCSGMCTTTGPLDAGALSDRPTTGLLPRARQEHPAGNGAPQLRASKNYFKAEKFKIKTGYRYLGGHIRMGKEDFVTEKVLEWVESVRKFLPMVRRNPQAVHTVICWSLQHEWAYLQRVIEVDPEKYAILDSIIQSELIPALFDADEVPNKFDQLFTLP